MNATLSTRQLRLVILLGLVIVLAGAWYALGYKSGTPSTSASSTPAVTTAPTTTPAPSKANAQSSTPAKPAKIDTHGLPLAVARALQKHRIVVVSLYSPSAAVDALASAESQAGAAAAGAGFVKLDVFHQQQGVSILRKFGVLDTPAVFVVKRPSEIYAEFKGFVDRNVVEQAIADARG